MNENNNEENGNGLTSFLAGLMFFAGLLVGGLAGTGTTLLLAPQSGKKTRRQIQRKGRDLRVQTADMIEDRAMQVRDKASQVGSAIREQAQDVQQWGKELVDHQK